MTIIADRKQANGSCFNAGTHNVRLSGEILAEGNRPAPRPHRRRPLAGHLPERYAHVTRIVRTDKDKLPLVTVEICVGLPGSADSAAKVSAHRPGRYDRPGRETQGEHQHRIAFVRADHHRLHLPRHIDNRVSVSAPS